VSTGTHSKFGRTIEEAANRRSAVTLEDKDEERMVTMIDEIFDRHYQAGRDALNESIAGAVARFGRALGDAFEVLNKIEYDAPWAAKPRRARCN
jgi:hypothetical protein